MYRRSRSVLTVSTAGLLCLFTVLAGAASAGSAGGVKGDPQPEMKPFQIAKTPTSESPGSAAIEPNGDIVVTYDISDGTTQKTAVCVLPRGARKCSTTVNLTPLSGDDVFTIPEVFTPSANHIVVLQNTCCDSSTDGGDLLYTSTDGGNTFGAPVRVGSVGVSAAELIGNDIVFSAGGGGGGANVESIPVTASGPPSSTAVAIKKTSYGNAVGAYKGGALIGSDFLGTDYTTYVAYAPAGDNFNSSASYHTVGTFSHEQLIWMSGDALLTIQTTGKQSVLLRLFNGSKFGPPHVVPGTNGGGPQWFTVDQDPSGTVHVFSSRAAVKTYHLIEVSTTNGSHWSRARNLGNAEVSNGFAAALGADGTGLVLGTPPPWGYPVLAPQHVSFSLSPSTITKGHTTTGSGKGAPAAKGRQVELQVEKSGRWDTVATTTEGSGGLFSFTIKGTSAGTFDYRAVAADVPGYLEYGYSTAQSLHVTG